jgi:GNAT superfamily N-acetyltransferase
MVGDVIRPLTLDDAPRGQQITFSALSSLDARMARPVQDLTDEVVVRSRDRILHLLETDPDGAWVAELDGEVAGIALALVREGMWFLSSLMVDPAYQGRNVGRDLLEAALKTSTDRSWIMTTDDTRAVHRYQRAGFELHPGYTAVGTPARDRIPAVQGLRDYDDDRELLDEVTRTVRGAAMGPEVDYFLRHGNRIVVAPGRGFVVLRPVGVTWLAALDEGTARDLLWVAVAEATVPLVVDWLTADQQWAIDVCISAGLHLRPGPSMALRGQPRMSPYIPCAAFG